MSDPKIIVALDCPDAPAAMALAARLDPGLCRAKVGKELYTAAGPALVRHLQEAGFSIFLDLKFHDIPNTVAAACRAAADLGVWMINVHSLGGRAMMTAAAEALAHRASRPKLVAVTVLTSMVEADMREVGLQDGPLDAVSRLARLAQSCGLDGVVCSAQEAPLLRQELGSGFCLVTPGVRPATVAKDDQQRVATPRQAIASGADYLVIGRPVTQAPDPLTALRAIAADIAG
jgi:orotidine-5'-phosphate decarboxylase